VRASATGKAHSGSPSRVWDSRVFAESYFQSEIGLHNQHLLGATPPVHSGDDSVTLGTNAP